MAFHPEHDKYVFSSGHEIHANGGIIGIDPYLCVSEGFDGGLFDVTSSGSDGDITPQDKIELADYMIYLWAQFKAIVSAKAAVSEKCEND